MTRPVYFTICSANYLAYARTLYGSLAVADPAAAQDFKVVLVDGKLDASVADSLPFEIVYAENLGIPNFWDMAMRYSVMEMNTAVKPAAFLHFFEMAGDNVIFLDPDIMVLRPLEHVHQALADGASLVMTPHSTEPLEDGLDPDDIRLLRTGAFNLGFLAAANRNDVRGFMAWWNRKMLGDCRVDLQNGLFVDQKFMDLAPSYLADVEILRHKGYNAAYWNLASRPVVFSDGEWLADGRPLYFFHFSGVVPGKPDIFSKHQNRFTASDIGHLRQLLDEYLGKLKGHGHSQFASIPYAFSVFKDGEPIPDVYRRLYAQEHQPSAKSRDKAFEYDVNLLMNPARGFSDRNVPITALMLRIWHERPDVQGSFPLTSPEGRRSFATWFVHSASREYKLPPEAVDPIAEALNLTVDRNGGAAVFSVRWLASKAMASAANFRGIYKFLPASLRLSIREFLVRKSAGHSSSGARISLGRKLDASLVPGIGIYGNFTAVSGVGEGARRMAKVVTAAGINHSNHVLTTNGNAPEILPVLDNTRSSASPYNCLLFHVNADNTPAVLDSLKAEETKGRYRIGYWAWELSHFPDEWVNAIDYLDEIWVPSTFVQKAVMGKTDKPVYVIPHPVFERVDSGETRTELGLPENRFLFLCSLDLNSFAARKNPLAIYQAFNLAFPKGSNPEGPQLIMKFHGNARHAEEHRNLMQTFIRDDRIIVIDMPLSQQRYSALQRNCDAYISLHRSEGFGMNIAEALQLGKPVVATDYSGSTDYLNSSNGYPVEFTLVPVRPGEYPQSAGQVWADPSVEHAAELLKAIVANPGEASEKGASGKKAVETKLSSAAVASIVQAHYERIQAEHFQDTFDGDQKSNS
ncbi:glycosyltransferase family 4 protein [Henriciella litoralis]|uniref:glycosyltransferase family 4 protein n=1 Tax=Henriciella litoralis TaxID=568102 RepID=UPI000A03E6B7|nr:glycosyltransferase family 4 protein [Henriciella litoralis]